VQKYNIRENTYGHDAKLYDIILAPITLHGVGLFSNKKSPEGLIF